MTKRTTRQPKQDSVRWHGYRVGLILIVGVLAVLIVAVRVLDPSILGDLWPGGDGDGSRSSGTVQTIRNPDAPLAEFYAPEVMRWRAYIEQWAKQYKLNPNVFAIIIQIESCGNPDAISGVGATGLMQVMPHNFQSGENMFDPNVNVERGMEHFKMCLDVFEEDLGLSMACYNGGFDRSQWIAETNHYYEWATGIWQDVVSGSQTSETVANWRAVDGGVLCVDSGSSPDF